MKSNASFAAFLLLAGCVGSREYSDTRGASAAPAAGLRDQGDAQPGPRPRHVAARDAHAQSPRLPDPDIGSPAGAPYGRPPSDRAFPGQIDGDPAAGIEGPRGSSQPGPDEQRYDEVGYAGVRGVAGGEANGGAVVAIARSVPPGSFVEVTSLENGRTILVLVTGAMEPGANHMLDLSPAAAHQLGAAGSSIPIRVRKVAASPADAVALRAGQPAGDRPDTPPILLNALRKHLPGGPPVAMVESASPQRQPSAPFRQPVRATPAREPVRVAPAREPVRAAPARSGYFVQVAALSNAGNAQALAHSLGGFVKSGGKLCRVEMGPYRTASEAEAARATAARRGFKDARVFTQ